MLDSFFPIMPPNFTNNRPLFNTSQFFTWSLQWSIFVLTWGTLCFFGKGISTKLRAEKYSADHTRV
jgi:hypothetical protein